MTGRSHYYPVDEEFLETLYLQWTYGLSPVEKRISIFSRIRDIPYAIVSEWVDSKDLMKLMIEENKGWCGPKHRLLFWMYQRLGIPIKYLLVPFRWQDQPVSYPDSVKSHFLYLPDSRHLCCMIYLHNSWQILDATWDTPLRKAGFPVNEPWDGIKETALAVVRSEDADESSIGKALRRPDRRTSFSSDLNEWLEQVRCSGENNE